MDIIKSIEHEQMKNSIPDLKVGDTVKVHQRIKEGNRERIQVFEGIVIKKQGGGVNATFTVRRVAYGCGVEKTFLIHSPMVEKIELVRVGKARRAKLYYLRERIGKAAKTKENIGARIENKEIVIKTPVEEVEEIPAEEVVTEEVVAPVEETVVEEVAAPVEEVKAEEPATEEAAEATVEEKKAEEPATEEAAEAPVEEEKAEEPAAEEAVEEEKAEEVATEEAAEEAAEEAKTEE